MAKKQQQGTSNLYIYLTILTVFITLTLATLLHDPILHWVWIKLNGWQFSGYSASVGVGSTDALVSPSQVASTSTFGYWMFFMFPSLFIFIFSFLVIIFHYDRLFAAAGIILIAMNFSSLLPALPGSDAQKAVQFLITRGWTEPTALLLHWLIFIIIVGIWGLYLYVVLENSNKDAVARAVNIWK